MSSLKLKISNGKIQAVYSDALVSLIALGSSEIRRASFVEPCAGGWQADLSPFSGPVLGPFTLRSEALTAEIAFLERNILHVER